MKNVIQQIELEKLTPHPDNPNRMSKSNFAKLLRNIEKTGKYEPLIVRPAKQAGLFQIINGHHRWAALEKLESKTADCVVWDIDDAQADIMLLTLNRLSGSDMLGKKLELLKRLSEKANPKELAKFLPQTASQIERLNSLKLPQLPAKATGKETCFANPLVFFVSDAQQEIIKKAIKEAIKKDEKEKEKTSAEKKAAALTKIAKIFLNQNAELKTDD